ncbi:hypothetical protein ABZS66_38670 [Dactylosporangium sp. NPDC005572]|uniref:hypothetical protein n=1 Tax=Dactylosporangium sp. NPDC005572 TaxID=3156889 RepID=UPI0033A8B2A3
MSAQPKRIPGQTNAEYHSGPDPNLQFLGTHSLEGGGDPFWVGRLYNAIADRLVNRRKIEGKSKRHGSDRSD